MPHNSAELEHIRFVLPSHSLPPGSPPRLALRPVGWAQTMPLSEQGVVPPLCCRVVAAGLRSQCAGLCVSTPLWAKNRSGFPGNCLGGHSNSIMFRAVLHCGQNSCAWPHSLVNECLRTVRAHAFATLLSTTESFLFCRPARTNGPAHPPHTSIVAAFQAALL